MAKVLFLLQLIVVVFLVPLLPGIPEGLRNTGLLFLGLILFAPLAAASAVWGFKNCFRALADSFSYRRLGSSAATTKAVWNFLVGIFPVTGLMAALIALWKVLASLGQPGTSLMPLTMAACWTVLGLSLFRILQEVVASLSGPPPTHGSPVLAGPFAEHYGLTQREIEAGNLLLQGLSYREIGDKLFISPATVKSHVLHLYQKTGAASKIELGLFLKEFEA